MGEDTISQEKKDLVPLAPSLYLETVISRQQSYKNSNTGMGRRGVVGGGDKGHRSQEAFCLRRRQQLEQAAAFPARAHPGGMDWPSDNCQSEDPGTLLHLHTIWNTPGTKPNIAVSM